MLEYFIDKIVPPLLVLFLGGKHSPIYYKKLPEYCRSIFGVSMKLAILVKKSALRFWGIIVHNLEIAIDTLTITLLMAYINILLKNDQAKLSSMLVAFFLLMFMMVALHDKKNGGNSFRPQLKAPGETGS